METEWSETTRRMVAVACVLIGVLVLYISRSVIPFIILAAILAFLLNPIVVFCSSRLRMPRPLAVALAYLLLIVAIVLTPLVLVPAIIDAIRDIDIDLMGLLDESTMWLQRSLEDIRHLQVLRYQLDLSPIVDPALEVLSGVVPEALMPSLGQIVTSLPSAVEITTGFASTILSTVLIAILASLFTLIYSIYRSAGRCSTGSRRPTVPNMRNWATWSGRCGSPTCVGRSPCVSLSARPPALAPPFWDFQGHCC